MSPRQSNRQNLIEGALRCLERLPAERITARAVAEEAEANLGSIVYHFGSMDVLMTEAVVEGLDRWLSEISRSFGQLQSVPASKRVQRATLMIERTRRQHAGLVRHLIAALAKAPHKRQIKKRLTLGFVQARSAIADLLGTGADQAGLDAAGLLHSMFVGLMLQVLLDPDLAIDGARMARAQTRLRDALPASR